MSGRARLDAIAKKLPPAAKPVPEPGAFLDRLPEAVKVCLTGCLLRAGECAGDEPACGDVLREVAWTARMRRRAPTFEEVQAAMLAGAGSRLTWMLGDERNADGCSVLTWEVLFYSATFGASEVYSLRGSALVAHWHRTGGTTDAETLERIGFGPAERRLLAAHD